MVWREAKRKSFPTPRLSPSPRGGALAYSKRSNASSELSCPRARRESHDLPNVVDRNGRRTIKNTRRKETRTMTTQSTTHRPGHCEGRLASWRELFRPRGIGLPG